jgi:uncharacterized protein (DUF1501 family)
MSYNRNSRREFLRKLACVACSGGTAAMIPQLRMIGSALANTKALTDYKALVCIYLSGGNDGWNLVVPFDTPRYNVYAAARSGVYTVGGANPNPGGLGLALPTGGQVAIQAITDGNDASPSTNQYFMHPNAPELAKLFQVNAATPSLSKKLALIVNAGTLVKPINKTTYNQSAANRPPQLFSHSDQEDLWHQANTSGSSVQGWGGLCGDVLQPNNLNQQLSSCISIAGANRFEIGMSTVPYQMSSGGLTALSGVCNPTPCAGVSTTSIRNGALNNLLGDTYANDFADEYGNVFQRGRDLYNLLSAGLTATTLTTTFPANNSLASQLQMVAKMIKLTKAQGLAQRQIYYVRYGGFDLHAGLMSGNGNHGQLLTAVSQAMNSFYKCLGADFGTAPGAQNEVTTFTASEFARTLQSNGSGSDHGWGGVQMVMGGAVNGGKLYSNGDLINGFPNQDLNAPNNFSRGQMIPGIGVEQYAATLAQWMGVSLAECNTIFPNLTNFTTKNLGFV